MKSAQTTSPDFTGTLTSRLSMSFIASKSFGFGIGLAVGAYIETKFINFDVEGSFKAKALRFCLGLVIVIAVYGSMKLLLPAGNLIAFIRYFCVPLTAVAVCPAVFKKLHL